MGFVPVIVCCCRSAVVVQAAEVCVCSTGKCFKRQTCMKAEIIALFRVRVKDR